MTYYLSSDSKKHNFKNYVNPVVSFIAGLVVILTVPALYESFEDHIDKYVILGYKNLHQLYVKLDKEYVSRVQKWILEKKKLSWSFLLKFFFFSRSWEWWGCEGLWEIVNLLFFSFFSNWFLPLRIYFHARAFQKTLRKCFVKLKVIQVYVILSWETSYTRISFRFDPWNETLRKCFINIISKLGNCDLVYLQINFTHESLLVVYAPMGWSNANMTCTY